MVLIVVSLLPVLGGTHDVPFVASGVEDRIVHPIVLTVDHVVADLHVLENLRKPEERHAGAPQRWDDAGEQHRPPADLGGSLQGCDAPQISRIRFADLFPDALADGIELCGDISSSSADSVIFAAARIGRAESNRGAS